ncbi:ribonuclease H-like domain-containing protein [Tanacetum coccineum]
MINDNLPPTPALTLSDKLMAMNHITTFVPKKLDVDAMNNSSSWIFSTLAPSLRKRLVDLNPTTAKDAWTYIEAIFQDNKRPRAMALKAKPCNLKLEDLSIDEYFQKIESIVSVLNGLGSPLSNDDVVTFALEGLPSTYETISTVIVSREPFPDLKMVRSFARRGPSLEKVNNPCWSFAKGSCRIGDAWVQQQQGGSFPGSVHLVQFTYNAYSSYHLFSSGSQGSGQATLFPNAFNTTTLQEPAFGNWNMDTGASSHLNDFVHCLSDILNMCIYPSVAVGDGRFIPLTNSGHSVLSIPFRPLRLNNVLITPNIVKNLISIRQFVRDNSCNCEFDPFVFCEDFRTRRLILQCDSTSESLSYTNHKLGPRTTPSIFLGHAANHFGYRCLDLNTNKIIISHHVTFDETVFLFPSTKSTTTPSYDFLDDSTDLISIIIRTAPITPVLAPVHTPLVDVPTPPTPPTSLTPPPPPTPHSVTQIILEHAPAPTNDPPTVSIHPMVTRSHVGTTRPNPRYAGHVSTISPLPRSYKEAFK